MTTPPITALDREAAMAFWHEPGRALTPGYVRLAEAFARHRTAAERATSPAGDAGEVERVARAINPRPFKQWQSMYDYCLRQGDSEVVARRYADDTHLADCEHALDAARAAIAAILPQAGDADVVGEPGA